MPTTFRANVARAANAIPLVRWFRQAWRDAPVRRKLLSVGLATLLLCLPPFAVAIALELRLRDVRADTVETAGYVTELDRLNDSLIDADTAVRYYVLTRFTNPQYAADNEAAAEKAQEQLDELEAELPDVVDLQMERLASAIDTQLQTQAILTDFDLRGMQLQEGGELLQFREQLNEILYGLLQVARATDETHTRVEELSKVLNTLLNDHRAEVDRIVGQLTRTTVVLLALAVVVVLAGAAAITGGIVRRIERLSVNSQRLLRGEAPLSTDYANDEIGRFAGDIAYAGELLGEKRREAEAATRAKDEFLWRVSHELRTPLTAIIGFGELLTENEDLAPEDLADAEHIVSAGKHLLSLIDELLDVAKIEAGQITVSVEPVDLAPMANEALALVQMMGAARGLTFSCECPDDLVAMADPLRLQQVLVNLLSNAVKYNSPRGSVALAAVPAAGEHVRISVTDTGPGISEADMALLFQPYQRLKAGSSAIEGSGIGLALAKRMVEAMGGVIGVESQLGKGTIFWIDLPAPGAPQPVAARPERQGTGPERGGTRPEGEGTRPEGEGTRPDDGDEGTRPEGEGEGAGEGG